MKTSFVCIGLAFAFGIAAAEGSKTAAPEKTSPDAFATAPAAKEKEAKTAPAATGKAEKPAPAKPEERIFFQYDQIPEELAIRIRREKSLTFRLEENATTGYAWHAVFDAKLAKVKVGRLPSDAKDLCGAPGAAEITVEPLTDRPFEVLLEYKRPWEKDTKPLKTLKCNVNQPPRTPRQN